MGGKTIYKKEIFGQIIAFAIGIEEQGQTSLHGHIILWVLNYHNLQQKFFSSDENVRKRCHEELIKYLDKVLCSTFHIQKHEVNIGVHDSNDSCLVNADSIERVSL